MIISKITPLPSHPRILEVAYKRSSKPLAALCVDTIISNEYGAVMLPALQNPHSTPR